MTAPTTSNAKPPANRQSSLGSERWLTATCHGGGRSGQLAEAQAVLRARLPSALLLRLSFGHGLDRRRFGFRRGEGVHGRRSSGSAAVIARIPAGLLRSAITGSAAGAAWQRSRGPRLGRGSLSTATTGMGAADGRAVAGGGAAIASSWRVVCVQKPSTAVSSLRTLSSVEDDFTCRSSIKPDWPSSACSTRVMRRSTLASTSRT